MKNRITFIVEVEVDVAKGLTHNDLGDILRPNIKEAVLGINKHWANKIERVEVIYIPVLLK